MDCSEAKRPVDERLEPLGEWALSEMQQGGLGQAPTELVCARHHQIGALCERVGRQVGMEAEVRAPRLVDDEDGSVGCATSASAPTSATAPK